MKRVTRATLQILAWGALIAGAIVFVIGPSWLARGGGSAVVRPVPAGDAEVVWMNTATNVVGWERFVAAIRRLEADPKLGLKIVEDSNAFPDQTTAVPELAVRVGGQRGRIWFRWYKRTSDIGTSQWVEALLRRDPPPLAIIGGGSSDRGRDLASDLQRARSSTLRPPLLLFTTATADHVQLDDGQMIDLMQIYPGRTFRFCFTNQQMAEAVTDFVWSHDDFRPDAEPIYLVRWKDDPYSNDLYDRFREVITGRHGEELGRRQAAKGVASDWAWAAGWVGTGGIPPGLAVEGLRYRDTPEAPFLGLPINFSEGDFSQPSFLDADAAEKLMDEYLQHPRQRRPLLVMPANPASGRRFLRALTRVAPIEAGRFVVATGDAIDFSTIYRDRRLAWHIQDLPVTLVIFCHRNPADPAAFQSDPSGERHRVPDPTGKTSTSTQDLLLYQDIVETLASAVFQDGALAGDSNALADAIRAARWPDGRPRFDDEGNQVGGSGEYVVSLEPIRHGDRVMPQALLRIWSRSPDAGRGWRLERRLVVRYFNPVPHSAPAPSGDKGKGERPSKP